MHYGSFQEEDVLGSSSLCRLPGRTEGRGAARMLLWADLFVKYELRKSIPGRWRRLQISPPSKNTENREISIALIVKTVAGVLAYISS